MRGWHSAPPGSPRRAVRRVHHAVLVTATAWSLLAAAPAAARQLPPTRAVLDLTVNTVARGQIEVRLDGDDVWVALDALSAAGVHVTGGERGTVDGQTFVRLRSLGRRLEYRFDENSLTLTLIVDPAWLARTVVTLSSTRPRGLTVTRAPSGFLNYGASWSTGTLGQLNLEGGVSLGPALASATWFTDSGGRSLRGQTSVTFDDPARLTRYVVGDAFAATGPLGGAVQLAGITVSRDYSLDPYFVRYATFGLSGAVTTPSRVEVYVNDQLVRVADLPPGSYELDRLRLPTGAADTRVVVRDAFGGAQEYGGSHYISTNVLAKGLHQFQYAAGTERLRPFESSWAYGRAVALAAHRVGVTDTLTLGGRAEARSDLFSGGPVLAARLGRFGAIEASGAMSRSGGRTGSAAALAYEYSARPGSVALALRRASREYATLASAHALGEPSREIAASGTLRLLPRLTVGATWQETDYQRVLPSIRRGSLSAGVTLASGWHLYATATRSESEGRWHTGAFAGLSFALGPRETANVSIERDGEGSRLSAAVQRALPLGTGVGYRVRAGTSPGLEPMVDGELRARMPWGEVTFHQTQLDGRRSSMAQVTGGLVAIGGHLHATRAVRDGFALVRVPGVPGVRTYLSHQEVGRTNERGELIVPDLLAYYGNQIAIADSDVPIDRTLSRNRALIAPPYRGGAIASFPAPREWRISGRLVPVESAEPPANRPLRIERPEGPVRTTLGPGGELYVEGLGPGSYRAVAGDGERACEATLIVPASDAPVIRIGEVPCRPLAGEVRP